MQAVSSVKWNERALASARKLLLIKAVVPVKWVQIAKFLFVENKPKFTMVENLHLWRFLRTNETYICHELFNRAGFALGWSCYKTTQGLFLNTIIRLHT